MVSFPFGRSILNRKIRLSPWVLFLVFLVSNALLSYSDFSLTAKFWIGTAGILLPLITALGSAYEDRHPKPPARPPDLPAFFPDRTGTAPPPWLWAFFGGSPGLDPFLQTDHLPFLAHRRRGHFFDDRHRS